MPRKRATDVRPGDRVRVGNGSATVTSSRVAEVDGRSVVHFVCEEPGRTIEWSEYVESEVELS